MGLLDNIFGSKKAKDLTRKELEQLAVKHKVEFTEATKDAELKELLEFVIAALKPSGKTLKVKFIVSPTGAYNLAYNVNEEAELPEQQAQELIDAKYAILVK